MRSGSAARRRRSAGCWARCQSDGPDGGPGRVDAGDHEQDHRPPHVVAVELAAVELRFEQERGQVVLRVREVLVDAGIHVLVELARLHQRPALLDGLVDVLEHHADEPPEDVGVLLREAEHPHDHPERDVLGVVDRRVDHRAAGGGVQQVDAELAGQRLEGLDALGRERGQQQAPRQGVERRVGGDRGGRADRRGKVVRPGAQLAHDHGSRREVLGVVGHGRDVLVAQRQPGAAIAVAVGDGAPGSQVVPDRVRVGHPLGVGVVEVGCPVLDGWALARHRLTP